MKVTAEPLLHGDLLGDLLVDHVAVRHLQEVGEAHVDLVLAGAPLALGELHRHTRAGEMPADRADQPLHLRALQHVVVLDVPAERLEVLEVLALRRLVGLAEHEELQLGSAHGHDTHRRGAFQLALENGPRRHVNQCAGLFIVHVAEHQRRPLQPGSAAQRRQIGFAVHVTVAVGPRREAVAGHRVHLHVARQEVIAGMHAVPEHLVAEERAADALAHQPAVEVGEGGEHGIDLAELDGLAQLRLGQHPHRTPVTHGDGVARPLPGWEQDRTPARQ